MIGYCQFNNEDYDNNLEDNLEIETGFKFEETKTTIEEIINKKFTEINLQDQVDDMLIECITELGMDSNQAYKGLEKYFNLPLVSDIEQGKIMISEFYKLKNIETNFMYVSMDPRGRYAKRPTQWV